MRHASNQQEFINNTKISDQTLKQFISTVDSSKISLENYQSYLQSTGKTTSKFGSTLKNIGGTILSSLANAGIGMLIGVAVNGIVSLIDYLVVTKKEIKEMAQAAQSNIDTVRSNFDNLSSTVESVGDTYARLRQGVQQTNSEIKNIDLSQSDYEEFLSVSNQIAELSPELISGYDAQGNAILNLKGDYDSIISSLDTFIEKQRESMNLEIAENLPDLFKGVKQDSDDYLKEIDEYSQQISSLKEAYASLNDPGFLENFENGILQFQEQDSHKFSLLATEYNELLKSLGLNKYINGNVTPTNLEKGSYFVDFSSAPKEEIQRAMSELSSIATEYQVQIGDLTDQVQQTTQKNAENWASLKDEMFAALSVDDSYKILSDQARSDVQSIINNMDWGSLMSNNDISEWSDLESWIDDNILSLFSGDNAASIQQAIAKAFDLQDALKSGEKSIGEYQKEISSILDSFDDLDDATKDAIEVSLEFTGEDGADLDTMINNVKGKLSDEFDGMVGSMSYDDLVFAYQIENTGEMTWDELLEKIQETKNLSNIPTLDLLAQSASVTESSITALTSALSEQNSAGNISSETYDSLIAANSDYTKAIEYTATGIQLNADKAKALTKANAELADAQIKAAKANDVAKYKENAEAIDKYTESLKNASNAGERDAIQARIDVLQSENTALEANIQQYDQLTASLRALTSTYNAWMTARSSSNEGDMYDNIFSGIEETKDLYDKGLVGTDDFRAFVDLMTYQDMSTASAGELVDAYEKARDNFSLFFTEGSEGCRNFLNRVHELNEEWAHINENGEWEIDFGKGGDEDVAEALGISVDAVQAALKKLRDYGFEVNLDFDDEGQSLDELVSKMEDGSSAAEILQDAIEGIDSSSLSTEDWSNLTTAIQEARDAVVAYQNQQLEQQYQDGNLNIDEVQENIDKFIEAQRVLAETQNSLSPTTNILDNGSFSHALADVQEAQEYLESLPEEIKEQLNIDPNEWAERIMNGEEFDVDINTSTAVSDLDALKIAAQQAYSVMMEDPTADNIANFQRYESLLSDLPDAIQTSMYLDISQPENAFTNFQQMAADYQAAIAVINKSEFGNVTVDTTQLDNAYQVLENISSVMYNLPDNIQTQLNIQGLSQEEILSKLQANEITIPTELQTPDTTAATAEVDSFVSYAQSQHPIINIDANLASAKQAVAAWTPIGKTITINANIRPTGATNLVQANGTAHADGTVGHSLRSDFVRKHHPIVHQAYYGGDWGIPYDQTALVGEIGPELLVRDGKWQLIGQRGTGFQGLKRGDIIFNSAQTEQIFKNGWVTGRGKSIGFNSHAMGTVNPRSFNNAFSSGSGMFYGGASSSNGYHAVTSASSSNKTSSSKKTSSSSSSKKEADDFSESLDEIEIKIDRIERAISQLDLKASSAFRTWTTRAEALGQQMSKVAEEIDIQQQGYDRYLQQANSVGLSADWVDKIQNGKIDIETITDEDLYDKIQEYQQW